MANASAKKIPTWALPNEWERDETSFFQAQDGTALTIYRSKSFSYGGPQIHARMFVNQVLVAAAIMFGRGNTDMKDGNVLSGIEVHPEHRGRRYSVLLMKLVQEHIGVVYRTGMVSKSGYANTKYLHLPIIPGRKIDAMTRDEYPIMDWSSGRFFD